MWSPTRGCPPSTPRRCVPEPDTLVLFWCSMTDTTCCWSIVIPYHELHLAGKCSHICRTPLGLPNPAFSWVNGRHYYFCLHEDRTRGIGLPVRIIGLQLGGVRMSSESGTFRQKKETILVSVVSSPRPHRGVPNVQRLTIPPYGGMSIPPTFTWCIPSSPSLNTLGIAYSLVLCWV
jgi:hypothetical protein